MTRLLLALLAMTSMLPSWLLAQTPTAQEPPPTLVMAKGDKGGSVTYAAPLAKVFRASAVVAAAQGTITFSDKDSGIISVNIGHSASAKRQARFSITITEDGERTTVEVATHGFMLGMGGWGDGPATKKYFKALTKELASKPN